MIYTNSPLLILPSGEVLLDGIAFRDEVDFNRRGSCWVSDKWPPVIEEVVDHMIELLEDEPDLWDPDLRIVRWRRLSRDILVEEEKSLSFAHTMQAIEATIAAVWKLR